MPALYRVLLHSLINMNNRKNRRFLVEPEIDFRYETETKKVMVDFKFDDLYK